MNIKRQINMRLFMFMIFILIQCKFDIDINNDELYENIRRKKKINYPNQGLLVKSNTHPTLGLKPILNGQFYNVISNKPSLDKPTVESLQEPAKMGNLV